MLNYLSKFYIKNERLSWVATTIFLTVFGLFILISWSSWQLGSTSNALAFLTGERLLADSYTKSFGVVASGDAKFLKFKLINVARTPIKIVGAKSSCSCTSVGTFPLTIPSGENREITVRFRSSRAGSFISSIYLYTDYHDQPEIVLKCQAQSYGGLKNRSQ